MPEERIINIYLDGTFNPKRTPQIDHEYTTAIADLLDKNFFHLCKNPGGKATSRGPYNLHLGIKDGRMVLNIRLMKLMESGKYEEQLEERIKVAMTPFRGTIKDYFFICESYFEAIKNSSSPSQIETIDMARRGLHNEGAAIMKDLLEPQIEMDFDTARRLFTLVCVLHIR